MSRPITVDVPWEDYPAEFWSGYRMGEGDIEAMLSSAVDYDWQSLMKSSEAPPKFSVADWYDIEWQGPIGSCAGQAGVGVAEVEYFKLTGKEIQFNANFTYILGQNRTPWRGGDNGTSVHSIMQSLKEDGACPMDWDKDGKIDYPYPPSYTNKIPAQAKTFAAPYKFGYHAVLTNFDDILAFLQTQGTVMVGGDWGRWGPDRSGLCDTFSSGGGGHAWMISGWDCTKATYNQDVLEGVNSHGKRWGVNGRHYLTRRWTDRFFQSRSSVAIGMSRLTVPGPTKYSYDMWARSIKLKMSRYQGV